MGHRGTLLAEDDPKMADLLTRALLRGGFQPVLAGTGDEALAVMRRCGPLAAAVLDIMIPHPDGIEVCRQLRRDRWGGPIVVISALSGADVLGRARSAGADLFLTKPFRLGTLVDALATMVDGHPRRDGGR